MLTKTKRTKVTDPLFTVANMGINMTGMKLYNVKYVDGVIIITSTFKELQTMVAEPATESEEALKMNYENYDKHAWLLEM